MVFKLASLQLIFMQRLILTNHRCQYNLTLMIKNTK